MVFLNPASPPHGHGAEGPPLSSTLPLPHLPPPGFHDTCCANERARLQKIVFANARCVACTWLCQPGPTSANTIYVCIYISLILDFRVLYPLRNLSGLRIACTTIRTWMDHDGWKAVRQSKPLRSIELGRRKMTTGDRFSLGITRFDRVLPPSTGLPLVDPRQEEFETGFHFIHSVVERSEKRISLSEKILIPHWSNSRTHTGARTRFYFLLRGDSFRLRWKSKGRNPEAGRWGLRFKNDLFLRRRRRRKDDRNDEMTNEEAMRRRHSLSPPASYDRYLDTVAMDWVKEDLVSVVDTG